MSYYDEREALLTPVKAKSQDTDPALDALDELEDLASAFDDDGHHLSAKALRSTITTIRAALADRITPGETSDREEETRHVAEQTAALHALTRVELDEYNYEGGLDAIEQDYATVRKYINNH